MIKPKKSKTQKIASADMTPYWTALGRFIHWFAHLEAVVLDLLAVEAGIKAPQRQALFSGVRIDQARDFVNRLYDARQKPRSPEMVETFNQIGVLTKARNDLVHYGALPSPNGGFSVHNLRQAHVASKFREWTVSPETLDDMTHDARKAWLTIGFVMVGSKGALKVLPDLERELMLGPWRYKPPPQSAPDQVPLWLRPKRKRLRASSPGSPRKRGNKVPKG